MKILKFFNMNSDNDIARALHHIIKWRPSKVTLIESDASICSFKIDDDIFDIDSGKIFLNEEELRISPKLVDQISEDLKKFNNNIKAKFADDFIEPQDRHTKEDWKRLYKNFQK
jgi:hypothetical protein